MRNRLFVPAFRDYRQILSIFEKLVEFFDGQNDGNALTLFVGEKFGMQIALHSRLLHP